MSSKQRRNICIMLIWLAIWEIASLLVHNNILLVGPVDVIFELIRKSTDISFYESIFKSLINIGLGFLIGTVLGIMLAVLSFRVKLVEDFLKPFMAFIKASPVASFVVLFLIWWHSNVLSIAICICVTLPQIYVNLLQGLKSMDENLLEMASVFRLSRVDKMHYIYRPQIISYMESAVKIAASTAWKAGVAAEVIGVPDKAIGSQLYMSKIYLDTQGVLAWSFMIIVLGFLSEKALLILLKWYARHEFKYSGPDNQARIESKIDSLNVQHLAKSFGDKSVLSDYSVTYNAGEKYIYNWPSGAGKTTLFKIIARITGQDEGAICPENYSVSMLFQDDRLIEDFSALVNVGIVCGDKDKAKKLLLMLLDEEDIERSVKYLSGGQRRRVAIVRALAARSDVLILDEPYEGLDENLRSSASDLIDSYRGNRITLIASHIAR